MLFNQTWLDLSFAAPRTLNKIPLLRAHWLMLGCVFVCEPRRTVHTVNNHFKQGSNVFWCHCAHFDLLRLVAWLVRAKLGKLLPILEAYLAHKFVAFFAHYWLLNNVLANGAPEIIALQLLLWYFDRQFAVNWCKLGGVWANDLGCALYELRTGTVKVLHYKVN